MLFKTGKILLYITFLFCLTPYAQKHHKSQVINLRGIKVWPNVKAEIKGIVNMKKGVIELLATTPGGKEHESIFVLNCNPALFQTSLLLLHIIPNENKSFSKISDVAKSYIYIYIRWNIGGKTTTVRAEEVIRNKETNKTMNLTPWIFTGSRFYKDNNGNKVFMANVSGALIATYYDRDAIVNNPLPGRSNDSIYFAYGKILPPKKTPVTFIFSKKPLKIKHK